MQVRKFKLVLLIAALLCPNLARGAGSCSPASTEFLTQVIEAFVIAHLGSNPRFQVFHYPDADFVNLIYDGSEGEPESGGLISLPKGCLPTFFALAGDAVAPFMPPHGRSKPAPFSDTSLSANAAPALLLGGTASTDSVSADFNGDGLPDFATLNHRKNLVNVYLTKADGSLAPVATYPVGQQPQALLTADINGDGHPDLIVANRGDNSASVLLGAASGAFQTAKSYPAGNTPWALALADVNGDGLQDLIVADCGDPSCTGTANTGTISVLLGLTGGAFAAPVTVAQGGAPFTVVAADFNGDGKVDIAYGSLGSKLISVVLGNGSGGFSPPTNSPSAGQGNYLGFGDFNGDGKLDLAVLDNFANLISILPGKGDGSFGTPASYAIGNSPGSFSLVDFAGNGRLDIAAGDQLSGSLGLLAGRPDGTFVGPRAYPTPDMPALVVAGDFNGDGKPDLVSAARNATTLSLFTNVGKGTFQGPTAVTLPGSAAALASGDFNGDGKADLAVATPAGVEILLGQGSGGFAQPIAVSTGSLAPTAIAAGDFNGDGKLDLVVAGSSAGQGSIQILLGDGAGSFHLSQTFQAGMNPGNLVVADLNGDGKPDVVMVDSGQLGQSNQPGGLFVILSQAGGTFANPVSYSAGANPAGAAVGDLNGDGKPDLAIATSTLDSTGFRQGSLEVFFNDGKGTFASPAITPIDSGPVAIAISDVNVDGVPDIVISNCCGFNDLNLLLGNGDGTFQALQEIPAGASPQGMAIADFDGNGKPDLAVAASGGGIIATGYVTVTLNAPFVGPSVVSVNAGSFIPGAVAPGSIVSGFGSTVTASGASALKEVGFFDAAGNELVATIFATSTGQVNYQIPPDAALGTGTAFFFASDGTLVLGSVNVVPVAPGIFTVGSKSLAAAQVVTTHADKSQTTTSTANCTSTGCVPVPINLGSSTDQVFLLLYATGLRGAKQSEVTVQVGDMNLTPEFAGPQGAFIGLDQINVKLPSTLKSAGDVVVKVTAAGKSANPVHITIQ